MLRMWMYDLAREQTPTAEHLDRMCRMSQEAGYDALGIYLEHRFAYASAEAMGMRAAGRDALTPEMVAWLRREHPNLRLIPFANLLGHMEGFLYASGGENLAEERFAGMQACPSNPKVAAFGRGLLDDVLAAFDDEIVHIGGDETWQLGVCGECKQRDKAELYGGFFGPMAEYVREKGRRPAVWGDMFLDHLSALGSMPKETLIFDWQYFGSPLESARKFVDAGHEVVLSPTVHVYNAPWCHLPQTERNVRDHAAAAAELNAYGVCVTTWEGGLFASYETLLPAIAGCGEILREESGNTPSPTVPPSAPSSLQGEPSLDYSSLTEAPTLLKAYLKAGERHEEWARLMGVELQEAGELFAFSQTRSPIKARLLLYGNPFLLWLRNRQSLLGDSGDKALEILDRAIAFAPDSGHRGVSEFVKIAIQIVRFTQEAAEAYAAGKPGVAAAALAPIRPAFDDLARIAKATHLRIGGSLADVERCAVAKEHVERVMRRIKQYGDGSLGYLPSFETISHPKFMPHDQANWWLINRWANE
ncbi:hypothetical protein EON82_18970 [bacterium]|nr:MAG: hypothetical protein EON82_18970 [bacterium]